MQKQRRSERTVVVQPVVDGVPVRRGEVGNQSRKPFPGGIFGRSGSALVIPSPVAAQLNLGTQRVVDLNRRKIELGLGLIRVDVVLGQLRRERTLRLRN